MRRKCAFFRERAVSSGNKYDFEMIDLVVSLQFKGSVDEKYFKNIQVEITYEEAKEE